MKMPPFKMCEVEEIRLISAAERRKALVRAGFNPFRLRDNEVAIDFLTDSGTVALSQEQQSAAVKASNAYCGSSSFARMKEAIKDVTDFEYVIPVQQGRGAEHVVDFVLVKGGSVVPGNAHFDTTKANIEIMGGEALDCTDAKAYNINSEHPFKGNMDLEKLENALKTKKRRVPYVLSTITCNQVGGQPVSMKNLRETSRLCKKYGVLFFLDGARFAENAYFIKTREREYGKTKISFIVKKMMNLADCVLVSAKKDCLAPGGGFIALRNEALYEKFLPYSTAFSGGIEYGGMTGATMEAIAVGIREGIGEKYIAYRISQINYLGDILAQIGVPFIKPPGGHGIFVDAGKWLPHIPWNKFPGHALACALYLEGGVRSVEIGSLLEGRNPATKQNRRAKMELLRLAIPHRAYTQEHFDCVAEVFHKLSKKRRAIRGIKIARETYPMRHFTSRFELL